MFNFGTGTENVTHLKNRTPFQYGAFKCGPASEPFVTFLKNICISLFGISWAFQNIVKMLPDNIRLYFILS